MSMRSLYLIYCYRFLYQRIIQNHLKWRICNLSTMEELNRTWSLIYNTPIVLMDSVAQKGNQLKKFMLR